MSARARRRGLGAAIAVALAALTWGLPAPAERTARAQEETESSLRPGTTAARDYAARALRGFDVRVDRALLVDEGPDAALGLRALDALERDLASVAERVPPAALPRLRAVPIFLSRADVVTACACYHPSAEWLEAHGFDPAKARAVELASAERYLEWRIEQPSMVLHELAHALEHRHLGAESARIDAALERMAESGTYDEVLRASGRRDRHYALTNRAEYFAETSEALFGTNDFWPFVRAELREADPDGAALVEELWRLE
ncbi:MAG: hypothetical protein AAFU73_22075 [Planctomycetota bacterium]